MRCGRNGSMAHRASFLIKIVKINIKVIFFLNFYTTFRVLFIFIFEKNVEKLLPHFTLGECSNGRWCPECRTTNEESKNTFCDFCASEIKQHESLLSIVHHFQLLIQYVLKQHQHPKKWTRAKKKGPWTNRLKSFSGKYFIWMASTN